MSELKIPLYLHLKLFEFFFDFFLFLQKVDLSEILTILDDSISCYKL